MSHFQCAAMAQMGMERAVEEFLLGSELDLEQPMY